MQGKNGIIAVLLLAIAAGLAWWLLAQPTAPSKPAPVALPETPDAGTGAADAPRYPMPLAPAPDKPQLQPLPPLNDSDNYLRMDITRVFGESVAELMVSEALIERVVTTIDNLPRQQVAERVRPVQPLPTPFVALGQDGSGEYLLGADNYQRYDLLVATLQSVDIDQMVELYTRYYPLFQKAYEGLGYPNAYFNDRLVEVLDHLLATPDAGSPVTLLRPHVLFEYADEDLAALSSGQKLLIRIGPEHRSKVIAVARAFRDRVAFSE